MLQSSALPGRMMTCACEPTSAKPAAMLSSASSTSSDEPLAHDEAYQMRVERLAESVCTVISSLGTEDVGREGLYDTPKRVARAWLDMTSGYQKNVTSLIGNALFNEPSVLAGKGGAGLVLVRDIRFASLSATSLFPFYGRLHVGYLPSRGVVLGLSKFARLAKALAARVQSQEELTAALAGALEAALQPAGVAVVMEGRHFGPAGDPPAPHLSAAVTGVFKAADGAPMQELVQMLHLHGAAVPDALWAPSNRQHGSSGCIVYALPQPAQQAAQLAAGGCCNAGAMRDAMLAVVEQLGTDLSQEAAERAVAGYVDTLRALTRGYAMQPSAAPPSVPEAAAAVPCSRDGCNGAGVAAANGPASAPHAVSRMPANGHGGACPPASAHGGAAAWGGDGAGGVAQYCVPFTALCEHHMLPFHGTFRVLVSGAGGTHAGSGAGARTAAAALPDPAVVAQAVEAFSRRLQVQERLTQQVADAVYSAATCGAARGASGGSSDGANGVHGASGAASLGCAAADGGCGVGSGGGGELSVAVVCEGVHLCMVARGVEKASSRTVTCAYRGAAARDAGARAAALALLRASAPPPPCDGPL